ncbi:hypothetical protein [Microbacterium sp. CJ88]|uniref:hypothetical protein n=1 Tax=Microbacterium sp. CJ88 TaxID=3445672 RepID=UPI003F65A5FE
MGQNRRFPYLGEQLAEERELRDAVRSGAPLQTLSKKELRLATVPLTIDPQPRRQVFAWIRFGDTPVRTRAVVARWTPDAVGIEFEIEGRTFRCWVWAGAVSELADVRREERK